MIKELIEDDTCEKVRIYPTKEQEQKLWQSVGTARFIYNYTLAKQEENYKMVVNLLTTELSEKN